LTDTGTVLGTPQYLAPEQALGTIVDGRADQYALAVVGFEMIAGFVPFDDETPHAIIHRHVNDAPPPLASLRNDVPAHVAAAIARALSKAPSHRFASMDDFRRALAGEPTDAARTIRRRAVVRRVVAALVVAAVVGGALFVTTRPDNTPARAKIAHPSPKKR
jgi:serine/threonine-protein kinase